MLKSRLVGMLILRGDIIVQSINFQRYLPVGRPDIAAQYLNRWGIDELVLVDITASAENRTISPDIVKSVARNSQAPLSVAGGIRNVEDIQRLLDHGADKISINTAWTDNHRLVSEAAGRFGAQCIVVSIDARKITDGTHRVYRDGGRTRIDTTPADQAHQAAELGAGEILLNSINRDGSKQGFDLGLIKSVSDRVHIPVVAVGGAGHPAHFKAALQAGASAAAAGNFFHFTEHSVITAKRYLLARDTHIRLDTRVTYQNLDIGADGRPLKIDDEVLERMRFEYVPEELI